MTGEEERASIVAWIRNMATESAVVTAGVSAETCHLMDRGVSVLLITAREIERGAHLPAKDESDA